MRGSTKLLTVIVTVMAGLVLSGHAQQAQPQGMEEALKALGTLMSGGTNAAPVVDFRDLKALLPATLQGMKRTNASGEKSAAMGMTVAYAEGTYEADGGGTINIKLSDNGGLGGIMAFAQASWAATEIDRESDTGFERTTTYGQHKAHEEYDNSGKYGKIEVLVGGRFMVEVSGNDVPFGSIQAAVKQVDLNKLATLKPKAAPAQ